MANQYPCDICHEEPAVQMLTNLGDGTTVMLGAGCLPVFYAQSTLSMLNAGEHKSIPSKCQACRRVHEHMTTPAHPIGRGDEPAELTQDGQPDPAQLTDTA
jgi:hypothetical protein